MIPIVLDLQGLRRNLRRKGTPPRVFGFEHGIAASVRDDIARRYDLGAAPAAQLAPHDAWRREIAVERCLGFELFRVWLPGGEFNVAGSLGTTWAEAHDGPIQCWHCPHLRLRNSGCALPQHVSPSEYHSSDSLLTWAAPHCWMIASVSDVAYWG